MAQFDPKLKRETWLFQKVRVKDSLNRQCLQLLPFRFVEYDEDPNRFIEPANHEEWGLNHARGFAPFVPMTDGAGVCASIETFERPPLAEVHEFHYI
jgi:hypothetical protein